MKSSHVLTLSLWAIPSALANFSNGGRDCQWFGSSPFCGSSGSSIGDRDAEGRELIITTRDQTRLAACYKLGFTSSNNNPCVQDYGTPCAFGYKRLWCYDRA